ncbi:MAG: NAD(P)H-dependent oxidoreductase [Candidatus Aureabacteria bacterium]|nr:NAD(P)H-dependent oxidoreductase [Candidatus Auribacterota bacterium]
MKKLLHIVAAPRGEDSRTLKVSRAFLDAFREKQPSCLIDELNVFTEPLPPLSVPVVQGKYVLLGGKDLTGNLKSAWGDVIRHIERFLSADGYLLSTPMWNFSIPYPLKHYIDVILQPKYLFRYTAEGVEGLAKNRKMVVIASRGGDYRPESPLHNYDFQEPYLRTVFGFVGITDITFVIAQPMDAAGPTVAGAAIEKAMALAREKARSL